MDETPVYVGNDEKKAISPPPKFIFTANNNKVSLPPPSLTPARGRGRPRAASPGKTPGHKGLASPRKGRAKKEAKDAKDTKDANAISAKEANASLQASLDSAASRADTESVDGDKVTVEVDSAIEVNGDIETTHTKVRVQMPANSPDLPLPENTEEMIAKAKEMVEAARKLEGESSSSASKRKAAEIDDEEDVEKDAQLQPAKKARLLELEVRKQRVRQRALMGVAATLAIGYVINLQGLSGVANHGTELSCHTCSERDTEDVPSMGEPAISKFRKRWMATWWFFASPNEPQPIRLIPPSCVL